MSYRCRNCKERFAFPAITLERHGMEGPWAEQFEICPYCKVAGMMEVIYDAGRSN